MVEPVAEPDEPVTAGKVGAPSNDQDGAPLRVRCVLAGETEGAGGWRGIRTREDGVAALTGFQDVKSSCV